MVYGYRTTVDCGSCYRTSLIWRLSDMNNETIMPMQLVVGVWYVIIGVWGLLTFVG